MSTQSLASTIKRRSKVELQSLINARDRLNRSDTLDEFLASLIEFARNTVRKAEQAMVFLEHGDGLVMRPGVALDEDDRARCGAISRGVFEEAVDKGVVLSAGLHADPRFHELDSVVSAPDRSVIAAGFAHGRARGVLYLEARGDRLDDIDTGALDRLTEIVGYAAAGVALRLDRERARVYQESQRARLRNPAIPPDWDLPSPTIARLVEWARTVVGLLPLEPILLQGEVGTGKSLLARTIHELTFDEDRPFIVVACGQLLPEIAAGELFGTVRGAFTGALDRTGLLHAAAGGTLVLDDVHQLPREVQGALLRALDSRMVRRVGAHKDQKIVHHTIATSSRDLSLLEAEGRFLPDLRSRLTGDQITVPALRDRSEDIVPLARRLVELGRRRLELPALPELTGEACRRLQSHAYRSGNVRELQKTIHRALVSANGGPILAEDIRFMRSPDDDRDAIGFPGPHGKGAAGGANPRIATLESVINTAERAHLKRAIAAGLGVEATCARLGISKSKYYSKVKEHKLSLR